MDMVSRLVWEIFHIIAHKKILPQTFTEGLMKLSLSFVVYAAGIMFIICNSFTVASNEFTPFFSGSC